MEVEVEVVFTKTETWSGYLTVDMDDFKPGMDEDQKEQAVLDAVGEWQSVNAFEDELDCDESEDSFVVDGYEVVRYGPDVVYNAPILKVNVTAMESVALAQDKAEVAHV